MSEVFLMTCSGDAVFAFAGMSLMGRVRSGEIEAGEDVEIMCMATEDVYETRIYSIQENGENLNWAGTNNQNISILTDLKFASFPKGSELIVYRKEEKNRAVALFYDLKSNRNAAQQTGSKSAGSTPNTKQTGRNSPRPQDEPTVRAERRTSSTEPSKKTVAGGGARWGKSSNSGDGNKRKLPIPILAGAAICLAAIFIIGIMMSGGDDDDVTIPDSPPDAGASQGDVESVDESWRADADSYIHVVTWDLDFSNSKGEHDDGTVSYNNTMLLENNTGHDITGIAFYVKNYEGYTVVNEDPDCADESPFYAEGYVPSGETGIMVARMRVSKEEYKLDTEHRLKHGNKSANFEDNDLSIVDAYPYRGGEGYVQPTGSISGPYKGSDGKPTYNATIDNDCEYPVHKDARIVAYKLEYNEKSEHDSIRVSSAKGKVDRELDAYSYENVIGEAFKNPGFEDKKYDWPASAYSVCVIDNMYSDGSHYSDEYREEYCY